MPCMKIAGRFALFLCFLLLAAAASHAQVHPSEAPLQFAEFGDFRLQSGAVIHNFHLGYRTVGKLNADKSNAILWPTWLDGRTENLLELIGPARIVDSGKYFVIVVDAIGNGVSTSPSNSKSQPLMEFPEFTIRDMVESEHRLVTEVFHLSHLRAVMGLSMGGMQTFSWALAYPDFMDLAIPIVGSPQSTSNDKLLWSAEIDAMELDPAWNNGHPTGPLTRGYAVSLEVGALNGFSPAYRVAHTAPGDFDSFFAALKKNATEDPGAACDQIRQRQAIIALDVPAELGVTLEKAAERAHAKFLVILSPQDHMANPIPAETFAKSIAAPVVTMDSTCGHQSTGCVAYGPIVSQFLASPASVRSVTLRDITSH
ncbi:MAG: alpha/beta fold hydrolase [Candidatus Acidiferrales bacterium]